MHNLNTKKCEYIDYFQSDDFLKVDVPQVVISRSMIQDTNNQGEETEIEQYFFLTKENKIQLVYPDTKDKFRKFRIINHLQQKCIIKEVDPYKRKVIMVLDKDTDHQLKEYTEVDSVDRDYVSVQKLFNLKFPVNES